MYKYNPDLHLQCLVLQTYNFSNRFVAIFWIKTWDNHALKRRHIGVKPHAIFTESRATNVDQFVTRQIRSSVDDSLIVNL
jgi:hypothetical protein